MRITADLKALLESEIQGRETLSECCLRLLRQRGKNVVALKLENENLQQLNVNQKTTIVQLEGTVRYYEGKSKPKKKVIELEYVPKVPSMQRKLG
jgi:hypothetical protein